ncbi:MAG: DNA recombination protein RmuC [Betaproteobacteria bacterium]|nr:DNA recombination protein RmuC [Betaproteobacteria bacterium]
MGINMDFLGGPIGWIITFVVGVVLGAAFVNWRMLGAQRAIAEELAAARARIEEREAAGTEIEMRAKLFAQELLKDQAQQLAQTNQINLSGLLTPLKIQFEQFTKEVSGLKETSQKDSSALAERIKLLLEAQQKISHDAQNLASALKGDNKMMGDWGEVILERVLEVSGLTKDREFFVQQTHAPAEDQSRARKPDVVIQLPEDRFLIVDSKVSLKAYEEYFNCDDEARKQTKLKEHLASIRAHMEGLSKKNYQGIHGDRSPDFVMMFIPVEPAFLLATGNDERLWLEGWNRHVLLVSPNTLLFVLRTVEYLWRQERVGRNAVEIANRGALLYDKFRGFVESMLSVRKNLDAASKSHEAAMRQLSEGPGNVIRQVEMMRDLGVKPDKSLPEDLLKIAMPDKD